MSVVVNFKDRTAIYSTPQKERQRLVASVADGIMYRLGVSFEANVIDIVSKALDATLFIQLFLNDLFFKILIVLSILSIILVTSLLLSDAEEKTFEYGILRSLGFQTSSLICLLVLQAITFAIPGILTGLVACYIAFIPVAYFLSNYVGYSIQTNLSVSATILGVVLGMLLPILVLFVYNEFLNMRCYNHV